MRADLSGRIARDLTAEKLKGRSFSVQRQAEAREEKKGQASADRTGRASRDLTEVLRAYASFVCG